MVKVSKSINNADIREVLPSEIDKSPIQSLTFEEQWNNQEVWIKSIYGQVKKDPNRPGDWSIWSLKPNKDVVSGRILNGGNRQEYIDNLIDVEKMDWGPLDGREDDSAIIKLPRISVIGFPYYTSKMDVIGLNPLLAAGLSQIKVEEGVFDGDVVYTLRNVTVNEIEDLTGIGFYNFRIGFVNGIKIHGYNVYNIRWPLTVVGVWKNEKFLNDFKKYFLKKPLIMTVKGADRNSLIKTVDSVLGAKYNQYALIVSKFLSVELVKEEPKISLLQDSGLADITDGVIDGYEVKTIHFTPNDCFEDLSKLPITEPNVLFYYQVVLKPDIKIYGHFIKMIEWKVMSSQKKSHSKFNMFLKKNLGKPMTLVCRLEDRSAIYSFSMGKRIRIRNVISLKLKNEIAGYDDDMTSLMPGGFPH